MDKHNFEPGKIDKCQICNSTNLIEVMKLGDQPLANSLIKDISDENCLIKIISEFEVSSEKFIEFINKPETKTRLIKNTQELMDRGGFGSPTFFLNKTDMYFGNDRLQLIEKLL